MSDYYNKFDQETNNGVVFDYDISGQKLRPEFLTAEEMNQRSEWASKREDLNDYYYEATIRERHNTAEDVLCERVVPPRLSSVGNSTRYHGGEKRNPVGPKELHDWNDLRESVASFVGDNTTQIKRRFGDIFLPSFVEARPLVDEADEKKFICEFVFHRLHRAGLFPGAEEDKPTQVSGLVDTAIKDGTRARVIVEFKSTHSLPLPMSASGVMARYANGKRSGDLKTDEEQKRRELDKLYVSDSIGQLLRYMGLNGCRYGALSSGTRTYFVRILDDGDAVAEKVYISDPWFVGEHNYIRAWAFIYSLTENETAFFVRFTGNSGVSWESSDDDYVGDDDSRGDSNDKDDGKDNNDGKDGKDGLNSGNYHGKKHTSTKHPSRSVLKGESYSIPHVDYESISFKGFLGSGRNGTVCRAVWNGIEVAVKQFDCAREGVNKRFNREVKAYELLADAQGLYVPRAYFVSEIPGLGMKFLGLQIGRTQTNDESFDKFGILKALETGYGFVHRDYVRGNSIVITDDSGIERLVMIDLEDYSINSERTNKP